MYGTSGEGNDGGWNVNGTLYVDDGRYMWCPKKGACERIEEIKEKQGKRFGIKFGPTDPEETHFLGANIISAKSRRVTAIRATSYIDQIVKRYADGDVSSPKFPAHWGTLPADETLVRSWEIAMATRAPAEPKLVKDYGSLFGSLLHATKFRVNELTRDLSSDDLCMCVCDVCMCDGDVDRPRRGRGRFLTIPIYKCHWVDKLLS